MLHCGGADGSLSFVDSSPTPKAGVRVGALTISTLKSKFGGSSIRGPDGSGSIDYAASSAFTHLLADYTLEMWVHRESYLGICYWAAQTGAQNDLLLEGLDTGAVRYRAGGGLTTDITTAAGLIALNTWHHVAVARASGTTRLFIDGVERGSSNITESMAGTNSLRVARGIYGFVDEVRITNGVARYVSGFTPSTTASEEPALLSAASNVTLPSLSVRTDSGAVSRIALPRLSSYSGDMVSGSMSGTLPALIAIACGPASAVLTGPSPTLFATARSSLGDNSFVYTAQKPTLSAFGGASADLAAPSPSLSITATAVNFGGAALQAPSPALSAEGTVSGTGQAALTFGNNLGSYDLVGYSGAVCSITLTGSPTLLTTGTTGSLGRATLTAPLFELTASGTAQNYGSAALVAPSAQLGGQAQAWLVAPGATLSAIGTAVVVATYEAYAVNLNHTPKRGVEPVDEVSRYTSFPFTHVVRYQNSYFGANATGLYLLEGTTDAGAAISYAIKTATSDLSSPNQKTVASAYLSGRLGPNAAVTLYAGEGAGVPYTYKTPRGALAQNHRQVFGKGIKQHRYYALGLSGSDAMELDSVELDVKQMNRRI